MCKWRRYDRILKLIWISRYENSLRTGVCSLLRLRSPHLSFTNIIAPSLNWLIGNNAECKVTVLCQPPNYLLMKAIAKWRVSSKLSTFQHLDVCWILGQSSADFIEINLCGIEYWCRRLQSTWRLWCLLSVSTWNLYLPTCKRFTGFIWVQEWKGQIGNDQRRLNNPLLSYELTNSLPQNPTHNITEKTGQKLISETI